MSCQAFFCYFTHVFLTVRNDVVSLMSHVAVAGNATTKTIIYSDSNITYLETSNGINSTTGEDKTCM